ncbi:MAG TPA: hypothetical protein VIN08_24365 [Ohtaekwangia sp.]|uniref:hypothetical protein n=1 Tax=Ohtaekwangia sp. TaxID=2066019 RepID=UPI002F949F3C
MKLKLISICAYLLVFFSSCDTKKDFEEETKKYFIKYYGEDGDQEAVDMVVNGDTVMILVNTTTPGNSQRILLIKTDLDGNVLRQNKLGNGKDSQGRAISEIAQDIEPTADGNYLVLSNMYRGIDAATNEDLYDFKVIKINANGDSIGGMEFGNNDGKWTTQYIHSITPLSDGGFVVTGNSTDETIAVDPGLPPPDQEDMFSIGFKNDFKTIAWTTLELGTPIGTTGEHFGSGIKVFEASSNRYIIFSYSDRQLLGATDFESNFEVMTFSGNGIPLGFADNSGKETSDEILASVAKVPSILGGGYYEFGTSIPLNASSNVGQLYFCKRYDDLSKKNEGTVSSVSGQFTAVSVTPCVVSEGYLLIANEKTTAGTTIRLIKTNLDSEEVWSVNMGSFDKTSKGACAVELPDGRILVLGTIELETQDKVGLMKVNAQGEFL